jgi:4-diphosphocytidyl-2-C-methyl-D-erythritol kinase
LVVSAPLDADGLVALMRECGNDLERPATALLPAIADIKGALSSQPGCLIAAMSGSGPTCFGTFVDAAAAARAAATLAHYDPRWWVVETRLGA